MKSSLVRIERGIYIRPSSQTYWIQYRVPLVPGGKRTRVVQERLRGCASVAQARSALAVRAGALFSGEFRRPNNDTTLAEFIPIFLASRMRRKTVAKYAQQLRDRFSSWLTRPLAAITRADLLSWYTARVAVCAIATANNEVAAFRALCSEAVAQDVIPRNPCFRLGLRNPHNDRDRILTRDEAFALSSAAANRADFVRPLWFLLYSTGARLHEILSLKWAQVDLGAKTLKIFDAKSGRPRAVPLAPPAIKHLRWWRRRTPGDFVFPGRGRHGHLVQVGKSWRSLCRRAGVQNLKRHDLRHNFVSQLQNAGVPDAIVMAITGHRTTKSLHRYTHTIDAAVRRAVQSLPWRSHGAVRQRKPTSKKAVKP